MPTLTAVTAAVFVAAPRMRVAIAARVVLRRRAPAAAHVLAPLAELPAGVTREVKLRAAEPVLVAAEGSVVAVAARVAAAAGTNASTSSARA